MRVSFATLMFQMHPMAPGWALMREEMPVLFDEMDDLGVQAVAEFPNGYSVSVIRNWMSFGGRKGLYEAAVLHGDDGIVDGPFGYLTPSDVTELLRKVEERAEAENGIPD